MAREVAPPRPQPLGHERAGQRSDRRPQRTGETLGRERAREPRERRVAAEQLVAAGAGQHGLDAGRGHGARDVVRVHGVDRRLIEAREHGRQIARDVGGVHVQLVMRRAEARRPPSARRSASDDSSSKPTVNVCRFAAPTDAARTRARPSRCRRRGTRRPARRRPGARERSRGPRARRRRETRRRRSAAPRACASDVGVRGAHVREHAALLAAVEPPAPPGARLEHLDAALPRQRRRDAAPRQKREDAGGRRSRRRARFAARSAPSSDANAMRPRAGRDIQRLDAEAVAREEQRALRRVPAGEREHAADVATAPPEPSRAIRRSSTSVSLPVDEALAVRLEVARAARGSCRPRR